MSLTRSGLQPANRCPHEKEKQVLSLAMQEDYRAIVTAQGAFLSTGHTQTECQCLGSAIRYNLHLSNARQPIHGAAPLWWPL